MKYGKAAQELIYARLNGSISASVYDVVPDQPPGMPSDSFPYVVIGYDDVQPYDTDNWVGSQVEASIHVWSTYKGKDEVKDLMEEIGSLLHRKTFSIPGAEVIQCLHLGSTVPDVGATKYVHGISRYRLIITEAL